MRIPCPYCGERDALEFVYRGDASPVRPEGEEGFHDYLYLRRNPAGPIHEHWYHAQGCRTWIVVNRHTVTHEVFGSEFAQKAAR
ncbi:MAG TPA: sarcosine oxidase subunit delta [Phenylobacterium sp.]|nr:sarcosine oxidase subunit delta [Phenylobacterium sp.]